MAEVSRGEVIGASGGVPAFGRLDIASGVVVVLLEVKAKGHIGGRGDAEVRPRNGELHSVAAGDGGCSVNKVRSGNFERDGGRVALAFDDVAVVGIVGGGVVVSSVQIDFHAVVLPRVHGVVLEDRVQDFDCHIEILIVPKGGEGGGVVVCSGDCSRD